MKARIGVGLSFALAASVQAQTAAACGPGAAFGVRSIGCASCSTKFSDDGRHQYSFQSEPVVLESNGYFKNGDVIVSVGHKPITTREGADNFTYPHPGGDSYRVEFRRGTEVVVTYMIPSGACGIPPRVVMAHEGPRAPGFNTIRADSISMRTGMYGFALACIPSCTKVKAATGADYWRYDGYPVMQFVADGGIADRAGVQVGDMLMAIGEHSILDEEGALRLQGSDRRDTLTLVLRRDGVERRFTLITRRAAMLDSVRRVRMDSIVRQRFLTPRRDTTRPPS